MANRLDRFLMSTFLPSSLELHLAIHSITSASAIIIIIIIVINNNNYNNTVVVVIVLVVVIVYFHHFQPLSSSSPSCSLSPLPYFLTTYSVVPRMTSFIPAFLVKFLIELTTWRFTYLLRVYFIWATHNESSRWTPLESGYVAYIPDTCVALSIPTISISLVPLFSQLISEMWVLLDLINSYAKTTKRNCTERKHLPNSYWNVEKEMRRRMGRGMLRWCYVS